MLRGGSKTRSKSQPAIYNKQPGKWFEQIIRVNRP